MGIIGFLALLVLVGLVILVIFYRKKKTSIEGEKVELEPIDLTQYAPLDVEKAHAPRRSRVDSDDTSWEIRFEELEIQKEIGRGAFGVISKNHTFQSNTFRLFTKDSGDLALLL